MNKNSILQVDGIPELVEYITNRHESTLWFRGMRCHTWHLEPSLWRYLLNTGLPLTIDQIKRTETRLLTRFRQQSLPYWPAGYPQTDWEHLFMMQHYGIPTRLLDWTTGLLTALYFALETHEITEHQHDHECLPTIWVLDPVVMNRTNKRFDGMEHIAILASSDKDANPWSPESRDFIDMGPEPIAMYGLYNSDRISSQHGSFTVSGKELTPIDELDATQGSGSYLSKIELLGDPTRMRRQLSLLGIHQSTVYPGLASIAHDLAKEGSK